MKLIYAANARIPSEKAHPYQIVQMCEAFAASGADVTLLYPNRINPPPMHTHDIWGYYGVSQSFRAERLFCIDLYPLERHLSGRLRILWSNVAAVIASITFLIALLFRLSAEPDAVIYSRDPLVLRVIAALWPKRARRLFFEPHTFPATGAGLRVRRWLAPRIGGFVVITAHLAERYRGVGVPADRLIIAHDGFREARFAVSGDRAYWRQQIGWPADAFIVGYMGRFQTLGMDKGLGDLANAVMSLVEDATNRPVRLGLVGGPDETVVELRALMVGSNHPDVICYAGQVPASEVPGYLRAFDVCVMPFPWTEHFAYYASPMKLFEYMASGTPVIATDLPATAEILRDSENGLLTPPSDAAALANALRRLRDDLPLAERLAAAAVRDVQHYTWSSRAAQIIEFIRAQLD